MKRALSVAMLAAGLALGAVASERFEPQGRTAASPAVKTGTLAADFSQPELARILRHGPWPIEWRADPSNRMSGRPEAIAFGKRLFFDPKLSGNGKFSCASCHLPELDFTDAKARGVGFVQLDRNTPGLLNVRLNRWFGWDGAADSLWSQSLRPIVDKREMAASTTHVGALVRGDAGLSSGYLKAVGAPPGPDDDLVTVNAGKALAAFQETLVSGRTPFDDFRDALGRGDLSAAGRYPAAAQRGLKIFVGKGNCSVCHFGPNFTNGEFADIGIPFFKASGGVDPGRFEGIKKLQESRANLLGAHNDDPGRSSATGTHHIRLEHRNWGEFRVPSLRNVARTAPYMHNGHLATLGEVVSYYSDLNEDRLHADGEKILRPLKLSETEKSDLIVFLQSLTSSQLVSY